MRRRRQGRCPCVHGSLSKRTRTQLALGESRLRVHETEEMPCAKAPSGREGAEQTGRSSGGEMVPTVQDEVRGM